MPELCQAQCAWLRNLMRLLVPAHPRPVLLDCWDCVSGVFVGIVLRRSNQQHPAMRFGYRLPQIGPIIVTINIT